MEWQAVGSPECPGKRVRLKAIILGAGRDDLQVVEVYHPGKEMQVPETWPKEAAVLGDWLRKGVEPGGG